MKFSTIFLFRKILKYTTITFAVLFAVCWGLLFLYQKYSQKQTANATGIQTASGIEKLEKYSIGGIEQWILVRGEDKANPVLLFLHGGPGAPLFPYARDIGHHTNLEKYFTVVYWEQRGTGKSFQFDIPEQSMSIKQLVSDAHELTRLLLARFNVPKIYLFARSWGSVIGLLTVQQYPQFYYAYIGSAQIVHPLKNDRYSYRKSIELARKFQNQKAVRELSEVGPPPYDYKELLVQRRRLTFLTSKLFNDGNVTRYQRYRLSFKKLLSTPEYTFWDVLKIGFDPYFSLKHLWNEQYYQLDLMKDVPVVKIPVYFLIGSQDYFVSPALAENYYRHLVAPAGKELIRFSEAGHNPEYQEPEKFFRVMVDKILEETYR